MDSQSAAAKSQALAPMRRRFSMTSELSRARELLALAVAMVEHEREPDAVRWQAPVEARVDELDGAVSAFLDAGDKNAALRLVGTLSYLWWATGSQRAPSSSTSREPLHRAR
jgi:hypothetical protein